MANIIEKLNKIRTAILGKEVRGALADGLEAVNTEVENTTINQTNLKKEFDTLIDTAGNSLGDLNSSITESTELKKQLDEWNNSNQDILELDERISGNTSGIQANANEIADIILALAECIKSDGSVPITEMLEFLGEWKGISFKNNILNEEFFIQMGNGGYLQHGYIKDGIKDYIFQLEQAGLVPMSANVKNLGSSSRPWKDIYIGSSSKGSNGYSTMMNGWTMQVFYKTFQRGYTHTVNFPVAFKNMSAAVVATSYNLNVENPICINGKNATGFSYRCTGTGELTAMFIAIGY